MPPRTVVIAPDSFKGSLPAATVAASIASGWRRHRPDDRLVLLPQADGGEGTLDAMAAAVPGTVRRSAGPVTGPDGRPTPGEWLRLPDGSAVVELAQCSGLPLMRKLDPLGATTRGLGEVIRAAVNAGATSLTIGLGGSASTDAAAGALAALGLRLLDADGEPLPDGGAALARLERIEATGLLVPPFVTLLTDVDAPLLGPSGAAAVFAPQKGASPEQVARLNAALARFAAVLGGDPDQRGTGAAGGAAYGFATAWGATIVPGADHIAELTGLKRALLDADVLLTGEGRFDAQSLSGKVVGRALARAGRHGVRTGVIAGQVALPGGPWTASLVGLSGSTEAAMEQPERWLAVAGAEAAAALG